MDLIERLRPKWRHADPEVRAAAVREMPAEEQKRLGTIALEDPDPRVRRLAVKKLADPDLLGRLAAADADPALRTLAAERLREVLVVEANAGGALTACEMALARLDDERSLVAVAARAAHEPVRRAALARLASDRARRDVVRSASDPTTRGEALAGIGDAAVLRGIAVGDGPLEVSLQAVEQIDDLDVLRAIAEHHGAHKQVRQRAHGRLPVDVAAGRSVGSKEGRARQLELCIAAQALRAEPDVLRAAEGVRALMQEWQGLVHVAEPRADTAQQFAAACEVVLTDAASIERRRAEASGRSAAIDDNLAARAALCERVEALDGPDALRDLAAARATWTGLSPIPEALGADVTRRFRLACEACEARHDRWLAHATRQEALEALVEEAEALAETSPPPAARRWKALERGWAALVPSGEPSDEIAPLAGRLAHAGERLARRRQEAERQQDEGARENLRRLDELYTRLEAMTPSEALKPHAARRALHAADAALADLGPLPPAERRAAWIERLSTARETLLRRVRKEEETEEWRRWANVGAQEEIIQRVEALLEANDLAEGTRQLGRLQDEWAEVSTATAEKSQVLWDRFRTARNELRRRCDAYLAENLEKKHALCAQVSGVGESTAWNETADLVKRLQAEWKAVGPVPSKHAQALWLQFREPCDRFFARRKEHFERVDGERRENAKKRTMLCEQAEALADSTDWEAVAKTLRDLQAEWKRGGAVPRAEGEALWQRFRAACDRFFERRSRREEVAREAQCEHAATLCAQMEALATAPEDLGPRLEAAWNEWLHLELNARDGAQVQVLVERWRAACEQLAGAHPDALRGTRLDPAATQKRRVKLCTRLEELEATLSGSPRTMSLQEMALALRDRLATNTIAGGAGGEAQRRQEAAREVERISATWERLGPVLGEDARRVAARFEEVRAQVRAAVQPR